MRQPGLCSAAAVFLFASLPATVHAQQSDVLEDFRDESLQFQRPDVLSVQERPQPAFDPVPYRDAGIEIMPSIKVDSLYNSNIFAERDARDDLIIRIRPKVAASTQFGNFNIATAAEVDHRQYLSTDSQSTTDYILGLRGRFDIDREGQIYAGTRNGQRTEDRTDPASPLNVQEPVQYRFASGFVGAARSFNRLRVAGRVGIERRDYEDGRDGLDLPVDQDFRNRTILTSDLAAEFAINPDISVFVNGSVNQRDYKAQPLFSPSRDSKGYEITAGTSFQLSSLVRSEIGIGYFEQDFEDARFEDVEGFAARAKLEYFVTPLVTLTARANRGVEESSTLGSGAFVATSFSLTADYELLRNLIISASGGYERNKFQDIDRRYTIASAKMSAEWRLSPRYALHAQYDFRDQEASGTFPGREFSRHRFLAGITIAGM
ncbi:outer membrane beta-barrel protein [Parasphingorhabdus cellanae]|uniref:Outer membrane beta-barrel protein n=1 Tax=Parasphingorhabdus cellanae TaxID=2806553 RepID=A0ABX7T183_9SPHN|nr:outer membrane beta-barrel protein [Parasphingorhabdus cellanae]QTD55300.1 outer membrane beta-barrel protein [Parasphingorhabdus cellanae]